MLDVVCPPRRMRFSFESRCRIVQLILAGESPQAAAAACGASRATGYRLWHRYCEGGWAALNDRPSTPRHQPRRLPAESEQEILAWREHLRAGPAVIAAILERPISTVGKVLRRGGCSRLPRTQRDPKVRYERDRPGELLHVDTKKLGRFFAVGKRILQDGVQRSPKAGWQHLHIAIDDHTRLAYAEQGIVVERVLSDNAKAYHSQLWRGTCAELTPSGPFVRGRARTRGHLLAGLRRPWGRGPRPPASGRLYVARWSAASH